MLATAKDEEVRDATVAIDSARTACELTDFANIGDLSALAASLAAAGKFEDAVGWQEKVVERVSNEYKEFAGKILERYMDEKQFAADPDKANAEEKALAEEEGKQKQAEKAKQDKDQKQANNDTDVDPDKA